MHVECPVRSREAALEFRRKKAERIRKLQRKVDQLSLNEAEWEVGAGTDCSSIFSIVI